MANEVAQAVLIGTGGSAEAHRNSPWPVFGGWVAQTALGDRSSEGTPQAGRRINPIWTWNQMPETQKCVQSAYSLTSVASTASVASDRIFNNLRMLGCYVHASSPSHGVSQDEAAAPQLCVIIEIRL